jgi:hypothetical protein
MAAFAAPSLNQGAGAGSGSSGGGGSGGSGGVGFAGIPGGGAALGSSGRCVSSSSASRPLTSCVWYACQMSRRYDRLRGWFASGGASVVPGGRFSGLDRCGTPSGGAGRPSAAAWTVPSVGGSGAGAGVTGAGRGAATARGAGAGAGAGAASTGAAGGAKGITGFGVTGSAIAGSAIAGAAKSNVAITLGPPISAVSTVALTSIVTDAPLPVTALVRPTGCFSLAGKIVTPVPPVMKRLKRIRRWRTRFTWSLT